MTEDQDRETNPQILASKRKHASYRDFEPTTAVERKPAKVGEEAGNWFSRFGIIGCVIRVLIALLFILVIISLCIVSLGITNIIPSPFTPLRQ